MNRPYGCISISPVIARRRGISAPTWQSVSPSSCGRGVIPFKARIATSAFGLLAMTQRFAGHAPLAYIVVGASCARPREGITYRRADDIRPYNLLWRCIKYQRAADCRPYILALIGRANGIRPYGLLWGCIPYRRAGAGPAPAVSYGGASLIGGRFVDRPYGI